MDDYSAYAFLLNNISSVYMSDDITIDPHILDKLSDNEAKILNDFLSRLNILVDRGAIKVDSGLKIMHVPAPDISNIPSPARREIIIDLMPETRQHAQELQDVYDSAVFGTAHIVAGTYFAEGVRSGGIWDYKVKLGTTTRYFESELQATMTGETIGNFHYGYVGSTCFGETTLKTAAGFVQILSGTSDISYWNSYFDDPADQEDIQWGINVYNNEHCI